MRTVGEYSHVVESVVTDTAASYHMLAADVQGGLLDVPCSYQIAEPGFRPFRAGKASGPELQAELNRIVTEAADLDIELGLENAESLRKLLIQNGLGIDCSAFTYQALGQAHAQFDLPDYASTVFIPTEGIRNLHRTKDSWKAKDEQGNERPLSPVERQQLYTQDVVTADWVADVFGKDPEFVMGSKHMVSPEAAIVVEPQDALPGDLIAFRKAGSGVVSHVAVIETVTLTGTDKVHLDFWHSWHTRGFDSGLRPDHVTITDEQFDWSHADLGNRYEGHYFARPKALHELVQSLEPEAA